jgi:hypothetical protein
LRPKKTCPSPPNIAYLNGYGGEAAGIRIGVERGEKRLQRISAHLVE